MALMKSKPELKLLVLTRFLDPNRYLPRIKSGAGFLAKAHYNFAP